MSIEVIGKIDRSKRQTTCWKCDVILQYENGDTQEDDKNGLTREYRKNSFIDCPKCRVRCYVKY